MFLNVQVHFCREVENANIDPETIDYIILLSGSVTLLLDDEVQLQPFDVVVQRGTNHAWVVDGTESALFIAVLIDSEIVE